METRKVHNNNSHEISTLHPRRTMVARLKQNATKLCFAGLVLVAVLMALHHEGSMLSRYAEYVTSGMVEYSPTASGEAYNTRISHSHNTTTTSINQQRSPVLYLHVGPHKTASSTIQTILTKLKNQLSQDSITFIGRYNPYDGQSFQKPITCKRLSYTRRNKSCLASVLPVLDKAQRRGNDVVFSDEYLGTELSVTKGTSTFDLARTNLDELGTLSKDWDVRIIMGYRPWFEFVVSRHNQYFKPSFQKMSMAFWPGEGGYVAPPLVDPSWTGRELSLNWTLAVNATDKYGKLRKFDIDNTILGTFETFSAYFDKVVVLDIHQDGFLETLLCSVMENADKACSAYKRMEKTSHANK